MMKDNSERSLREWTSCLLLAPCLLAACAAPNIADSFRLQEDSGAGVAVGTITYSGGYGSYRVLLESVSTKKSYTIEHGSGQTLNPVLAFRGEEPHPRLQATGSPFAVELPAGAYVLKSWRFSQGAANIWSTGATNLQFDVPAGKAVYIGNFHFIETSRFARMTTGISVTLSDQSDRDLPAVRDGFRALGQTELALSLAPGTKIENLGGGTAGRVTMPTFVPAPR
jgi:hypothetical protein